MSELDYRSLGAGQHVHVKAANTRLVSRRVEMLQAATNTGRARTLAAWWCERFHQDHWSCLDPANGVWQCQRCSRAWMVA